MPQNLCLIIFYYCLFNHTVGVYYIGSAGDLNLQIGSIKIFQLSEIPVARNPGEAVGRTPSSEAEGRTHLRAKRSSAGEAVDRTSPSEAEGRTQLRMKRSRKSSEAGSRT